MGLLVNALFCFNMNPTYKEITDIPTPGARLHRRAKVKTFSLMRHIAVHLSAVAQARESKDGHPMLFRNHME